MQLSVAQRHPGAVSAPSEGAEVLRISRAGCRGAPASRLRRVTRAFGSGERRVLQLIVDWRCVVYIQTWPGGFMHAPAAGWRKPASTWGHAAGPGCHNVYYRTPAYPTSASGERSPDSVRKPTAPASRTNSSKVGKERLPKR